MQTRAKCRRESKESGQFPLQMAIAVLPPFPLHPRLKHRATMFTTAGCSQVFEAWRWLLENVTGIFHLLDIYRATPRLHPAKSPLNRPSMGRDT